MISGAGNNPGNAATQALNSPMTSAGVANPDVGGGFQQKDAKEASTDPKFGEIWNQIQAKYGAKPEKPKEIKKTLGKDDFLRIMITQMKNQDPTSPFKPEQMAAQMAQFASVEQLQNVNVALNKMSNQNRPLEHLAMTNLIGKTVTIDRERFPHTEGENESLTYTLPRDASKVKVALISAESGETVLEKELGPQKKGEGNFSWDGKKINTLPAKTGTYMLRVEATDSSGHLMESDPMKTARVIGVSFEGSEPVFLVGDAKHQDKVAMRSVIRIETDAAPGAPVSTDLAQASRSRPNFISFQKGVGSTTADADKMSPEIQQALEKFANQQQESQQAPQPRAEGFPNGLKDADESVNTAKTPNNLKGGEKQ